MWKLAKFFALLMSQADHSTGGVMPGGPGGEIGGRSGPVGFVCSGGGMGSFGSLGDASGLDTPDLSFMRSSIERRKYINVRRTHEASVVAE